MVWMGLCLTPDSFNTVLYFGLSEIYMTDFVKTSIRLCEEQVETGHLAQLPY